ncbi:MAG: hypothetical protein QN125_12290, partial [Armatimonadota bacterium]|nr:hypothetical protein [Armatimonadota bacterium]
MRLLQRVFPRVAAIAVLAALGLVPATGPQAQAQTTAQRLVIGIGSIPNTPDPHLDSTANALPAYATIFEKLIESDG